MARVTTAKTNIRNVKKELDRIDRLFADLERDKTLPTFVDFFMACLILGTAERVNLRAMYPKAYRKFSAALARHRKEIAAREG